MSRSTKRQSQSRKAARQKIKRNIHNDIHNDIHIFHNNSNGYNNIMKDPDVNNDDALNLPVYDEPVENDNAIDIVRKLQEAAKKYHQEHTSHKCRSYYTGNSIRTKRRKNQQQREAV